MITGRWGKPDEVLLDIVVDSDGGVRGVANPGRQDAIIQRGHFDAATRAVELEGEHRDRDGRTIAFRIRGRLDGRTLRVSYEFGEMCGETDIVRVDDYAPRALTLVDQLKVRIDDARRAWYALSRPTGTVNAQAMVERGESIDSVIFRDAAASDIPALAELHVTTWNATYRTARGPTVETRAWQWNEVFNKTDRRDFVLVLEDRNRRLIGFAWGKPHHGEFGGELSKIYLRWEYHGLGLGRRMMRETAQRFLDRNIQSFVLFAERSNPTIGFYDRLGGERLLDERGQFTGAYAWHDLKTLI